MLRLIRNCSHKNEVATFYFEKNQEKGVFKASSSPGGMGGINKEVKGWAWYQSKRYPEVVKSLCEIVESKESYLRIKIRYIEGRKEKYSRGIQMNAALVNNVIQHYCYIWQNDNATTVPLHGDLSIDNVISNKDGVHIIDWEHFSFEGAPFGFDAYNLLFEQLWFSMKGRKRLRKRELDILLSNIRTIRVLSTESSCFFDQPLFSVQEFIRTNHRLWKNQIYRLPVLLFDEEKVAIIDEMVKLHI